MSVSSLARGLSRRIPFFYGWVVLFAVSCAGFARQGPAVATLSIFVDPMTTEFGWSRTAISGAVSVSGVLAAILAPLLGPVLDRYGARVMLSLAVLATGIAVASLAFTTSIFYFYAAFCVARTCFAGPFDLGIYGAVNNWFFRHRAIATAISNLAMMAGLVCLPLVAQVSIEVGGWRTAWLVVGGVVVAVGLLPAWLLIGRRPEDLGLEMDGGPGGKSGAAGATSGHRAEPGEPSFTRAEALRTPAFWLLSAFTLLVFPIQAGVSLHQAPLLLERGLSPGTAALVVATFSLFSGLSGLAFGVVVRRIGVRASLLLGSYVMLLAVFALEALTNSTQAFVAAGLFGVGLGALFTTLPVAWADFFGRESYGAIRGIALSIQVIAQASGPLISGILRDVTGTYSMSLYSFAGFAGAAFLVAAFLRRPRQAGTAIAREP